MATNASKPGASSAFNTPPWITIAILITGGLFAFAWLAVVARRLLPREANTLLWLLPLGAMLWVGGATFMVRGALAPTIPGETGNPQFLAGFILTTLCLALMFVFNNILTRGLPKEAGRAAIHSRVVAFTACAVGLLLSQLVDELTPVAPQNHDILALFQFLCLMIGAVVGIQWVERMHVQYVAFAKTSIASIPAAAAVDGSAQRL